MRWIKDPSGRKVRLTQEREKIKVWYDLEGDFLEVMFKEKEGYFRETDNEYVMERVDKEGNILGFSILAVSKLKQAPVSATLIPSKY